jgi:predicted ATP-dependent serine protease
VLILAVEEHRRDVRLRLERFGIQREDAIYLHSGRLDTSEFRRVRQFCRDESIGLVLVDTLSRYWQIREENSNTEVIAAVSPFLDLAHEDNVTVLLVHHERKAGGAYTGEGEHRDRSMVNAPIGDRDRSEATLAGRSAVELALLPS